MTEQFTSQSDHLRAHKARQDFEQGLVPIDPSLLVLVARRVFLCHAAPEQFATEAAERYIGEKIRLGPPVSTGEWQRRGEATVLAWVDFLCFSEQAPAPNGALQAMLATFSEAETVSLTVAIAVISRDAIMAAEPERARPPRTARVALST